MKLRSRWTLICVLLGSGWLGQLALRQHVAAAGALPAQALVKPLAELPLVWPGWRGQDQRIDDPQLFGDEHLRRRYRRGQTGPTVELWLVYSRAGADRGHHPEVCMAVAGQSEDLAGRASIPVPGHPAPVQQYRFGSPGRSQLVFYWYYTLLAPASEGVDAMQRLYQRLHGRPASVTVEVFMPEYTPDDREQAWEFVRGLDATLQAHLPTSAVRGSQRIPVTVVDR